ncbi:MAG: nucleoside 2-deoxyribosyltransferase [Candidatus Colwellbacteria bacterium]|nr:nucleoside 2-deoxyribosyltransferase [Candidatus Colwellbacteria bacterium]
MRIYITSSLGDEKEEIERLCSIVRSAGLEDFNFIRDYPEPFDDPRYLMEKSKEEIKKSDVLLIDVTNKPTGRAIEAGMAYSLGKKIIVIMKRGTEIKDTTRGIANKIIEYDVIEDIIPELEEFLDNGNGQ